MRLDVGCGASPTGEVNVDLMLKDSCLEWDLNPKGYRNFVKADVRFLPFRDNSFTEVFCSHLLEHIDKPQTGLKELIRVSSKKVIVILPFALFSIFDIFVAKRDFGKHLKWLRANHKHFFLMNPLKVGRCELRFIGLVDAYKFHKKSFSGLRIPIPFETRTEILKSG